MKPFEVKNTGKGELEWCFHKLGTATVFGHASETWVWVTLKQGQSFKVQA